MLRFEGSASRVDGIRLGVQMLGVQGLGFRVQYLQFLDSGSGFRAEGLGFTASPFSMVVTPASETADSLM